MARPDDFLNLLADYLEGGGVTNVRTGIHPANPDNVTSLLGLQGNTVQANRDVAGLQFPRFQAVIRNVDYEDASTQFRLVRELLHGIVGLILPVGAQTDPELPDPDPYVRILRCHADQEGGPIGEDGKGRYEFSINFSAEYHDVNTED